MKDSSTVLLKTYALELVLVRLCVAEQAVHGGTVK